MYKWHKILIIVLFLINSLAIGVTISGTMIAKRQAEYTKLANDSVDSAIKTSFQRLSNSLNEEINTDLKTKNKKESDVVIINKFSVNLEDKALQEILRQSLAAPPTAPYAQGFISNSEEVFVYSAITMLKNNVKKNFVILVPINQMISELGRSSPIENLHWVDVVDTTLYPIRDEITKELVGSIAYTITPNPIGNDLWYMLGFLVISTLLIGIVIVYLLGKE